MANDLMKVNKSTNSAISGITAGNYDGIAGLNLANLVKATDGIKSDVVRAAVVDLANTAGAAVVDTGVALRSVCVKLAALQASIESGTESGYSDFKEFVTATSAGDYGKLRKMARAGYVYGSDKFPAALRSMSWAKLNELNAAIADPDQQLILLRMVKDGTITADTTLQKLREYAAQIKLEAARTDTDTENATEGTENATEGTESSTEGTENATERKPEPVQYALYVGAVPVSMHFPDADGKVDTVRKSAALDEVRAYLDTKTAGAVVFKVPRPRKDAAFIERRVMVVDTSAVVLTIATPPAAVNADAAAVYDKMVSGGLDKDAAAAAVAAMYGEDWRSAEPEYMDW